MSLENITLTAFQKNFDRADLFARGFCNKKGKQHKLNIEKSFLNIVNKISSFLFLFFAGSLFYTAYKAFQIMPLTK